MITDDREWPVIGDLKIVGDQEELDSLLAEVGDEDTVQIGLQMLTPSHVTKDGENLVAPDAQTDFLLQFATPSGKQPGLLLRFTRCDRFTWEIGLMGALHATWSESKVEFMTHNQEVPVISCEVVEYRSLSKEEAWGLHDNIILKNDHFDALGDPVDR